MSENDKKYDLEERLVDFAVRIIHLSESLPKSKAANHIAGQIIRSGTSPRSDFLHKMKICLKELRETKVGLLMMIKAKLIKPLSKLDSLMDENNQLISIFVSSISTAGKK
ncbi:MAG: four helix bundle protein [Deltaproteobacteria bacterium]|nr:four helix bundle protein [Deltaproteobacteria bacterium]